MPQLWQGRMLVLMLHLRSLTRIQTAQRSEKPVRRWAAAQWKAIQPMRRHQAEGLMQAPLRHLQPVAELPELHGQVMSHLFFPDVCDAMS